MNSRVYITAETVPGTEENHAAASAARVTECTWQAREIEPIELSAIVATQDTVAGAAAAAPYRGGRLGGPLFLGSAAATAPKPLGILLQALGYAEAVTATIAYDQIAEPDAAASLYSFSLDQEINIKAGGLLRTAYGCRVGNFVLDWTPNGAWTWSCDWVGAYKIDAAFGGSFTAAESDMATAYAPSLVATQLHTSGTVFSMLAYTSYVVRRVTVTIPVVATMLLDGQAPTTNNRLVPASIQRTDAVTVTAEVERVLEATDSFYTKLAAATPGDGAIIAGNGTRTLTMNLESMQWAADEEIVSVRPMVVRRTARCRWDGTNPGIGFVHA